MKRRNIICSVAGLLATFGMNAAAGNYLFEAESFQFKGKWFSESSSDCMGSSMLRLGGGGSLDVRYDALTVVKIPESGEYNVWVRSADYDKLQGTRRFRLSVNEQPMAESGVHGKSGWYWENVGKVHLDKGEALLRLHDSNRNFGRCDAVLFSSDVSVDPNGLDRKEIGKWRRNPEKIVTHSSGLENISAAVEAGYDTQTIAAVENSCLRLSFVKTASGAIACRTEVNVNGSWRRFYSNLEDNKVFLISSKINEIGYDKFFASWKEPKAESRFVFGGKTYMVRSDADYMNPFVAGDLSEAIPVSAEKVNDRSISVTYITKNGSVICGMWNLPEKGYYMEAVLSCTASEDAMYSMGVTALQPVPPSVVTNVLMPPMFQFQRIPETPILMPSSMMQQPLSIVETSTVHGGVMSSFVCGDDTVFPEDWGSAAYSPVGFSLRNQNNEIQPSAFSPIIGLADSKVRAGDSIVRKFVVGTVPDTWAGALEYISEDIYKVKDYRKQEKVSLTDAMFNIWELMADSEFGGWDADMKGFYDIEGDPGTAPTVVHSAPLAVISAAVVSGDEDFYMKRALPTVEYTLSRSGYRWATDVVPSGYNKTLETLELNPLKSQFNTSYYEGLNSMLGKLNPWLEKIALPDGRIRQTKGYATPVLSYVQYLSAYRMTGDMKWLDQAISTADRYVDMHIYGKQDKPSGSMAFYNSNVYPSWWNLVDLYEITKNKKYLDAARYGAASTIAGIRSYPAVNGNLMTIHPGGKFEGNTTMWWKGKEKFRLGFPRVPGDAPEKQVPDWLVSPVGLGFEQSGTYFLRQSGKQVRPVFMSSWAPHLLRLYRHTGEDIYRTYARNAVIGRFGNYPGYYATGYTDITMSEDFPYKGPDVSSIYYHHIPPHLAFTWDYLVSEAMDRSRGNVEFPYSLQEGFVWFTNRVYNAEPGNVFSDRNARLWMKRNLIRVDRPDVNYVTAISDKYFWILLSSESDDEMKVNLKLADVTPKLVPESGAVQYTENGKSSKLVRDKDGVEVVLPAKGFRAIALPLLKTRTESIPALKRGMEVLDTGDVFGKVFLFRIRSMFGWDSIYGFAETAPRKDRNLSVSVECNGMSTTVSGYPFEWSFHKIGIDEKAVVRMRFCEDGKPEVVKEIVMDSK